jgi:hypothetical protein
MCLTIEHSLRKRYPFAAIRGQRVTRLEEKDLGPFQLDAKTAEQLAEENIGVFIGGYRDWDWITDRLNILAATPYPARWLVVLATKQLADAVYGNLALKPDRRERIHVPSFWNHHNVTYTTPEGLNSCRGIVESNGPPAAVLLVDPVCHVHKARDWFVPGRGVHDRPQRIADFRADLGRNGRSPPFLVLTKQPAKSVSTQRMLSAYCLDAWWFVDGRRLRVGQPPAISHQSRHLQSLRLAI